MSGGKSVVVLTPNGRRQTVKVTPNTTILQVLEEVCRKHGFQAEEYDIKHHNHVMDLTSVMRFSGLPNNAQLEMAPASKQRRESEVTVALQLESGSRHMGNFAPADNLWVIVQQLSPEGTDIDLNPVVIYMRAEVVGAQKLKETTLKQLGITGGRAMLRLIHRAPEELQHQANVSAPLQPRLVETPVNKPDVYRKAQPKEIELRSAPSTKTYQESHVVGSTEDSCKYVAMQEQTVPSKKLERSEKMSASKHNYVESAKLKTDIDDSMDVDVHIGGASSSNSEKCGNSVPEPVEEEVFLLGDRNAIAFNSSCVHYAVYDDLPDDFFDLTVEDARILLRDIKRQRTELEEAPITTSAMRELEASKQVLNNLGRYKKSVIRVYFPDQLVLQGTFVPHETVGTVAQFVKSYLCDPELPFYLFTAPPKVILPEDKHLVEVGLVPSAVVHFGTEKPTGDGSYLKPEIMNRLTSPAAASNAAARHRGIKPVKQRMTRVNEEQPSTSGMQPHQSREKSGQRAATPSTDTNPTKVPKWFKPIK